MSEPEEDFEDFETDEGGFVPAVFARSQGEAEEYCELLNDHEIPAKIGADEELSDEEGEEHRQAARRGMTHGVPVLVPDTLLEEASEIIADREEFPENDDEEQDEEDDEPFGLGEEVEPEGEADENEAADVLEEEEQEDKLDEESDDEDDPFFDDEDDELDDETEA